MFYRILLAAVILSLVAGCKSKLTLSSERTSDEGGGEQPAENTLAAKLTSDECIDPELSDLKKGKKIMLCDGTIAEGTFEGDFPQAENVLASDTVNGSSGTMSDFSGSWSLSDSWPGAGFFDTQPSFSLSKVCDDTDLFGVSGTADCSGGSFGTHMGSFLHRDKTTAQISVADEIALGPSTPPPAGHYEVPRVGNTGVTAGDDYGHPDSASVDQVVRNSDSEWEAATLRRVCGKAATSIATKITDCDSRHSANRPGFDTAAGDGRLMWNGAERGNASEGSWTLVTVYHPSFADGTTCDAACREVWRDDRTGLLWGDKIGGVATAALSGTFSWCVASGNTEAAVGGNTVECSPGDDAGYNEWTDGSTYNGVSLCTEVAGMLTPDGTGATDGGGADDWPMAANTEVIDAKGGMDLSSAPEVRWRLPSVHDQAQSLLVNGGYYVLPNIRANSPNFWSSSVKADSRNNAWLLNGSYGNISTNMRSFSFAVRCVGR